MNTLKLIMCASAATLGLGWAGAAAAQTATPAPAPAAAPAAPAAPTPSPMANPPITAPMAANPFPTVVDAGPLGKITVDGVVSGLVGYQSPSPTFFGGPDRSSGFADLSNAQIMINKSDGVFQFYVQAGDYSLPALGATYFKAGVEPPQTFGYVPEGFIKIVPNAMWSVEAGALPTLIGDEYNFTFQNMNIERGLLWGQEPAISKGVQVNFTQGPIAISVAYTDGYYSNTYSAISGLATYTFKNSDTLAFAGEGNVTTNHVSTFATPLAQNNGEIFNLIYSHSAGPWSISPYLQYQSNPRVHGAFGVPLAASASAWAGAVLTKYNFTPEISVAGRVEYISSSGQQNILGFGAGSNAWSITVTPTYQKGVFFARAEASYVSIGSGDSIDGDEFGQFGNHGSQVRVMGETGIDF
jgi:Putative beta-barrel porin-2, OmpL-like. bbp2